MGTGPDGLYIGFGLALQVVVIVGGVIWRLTRVENAIREELNAMRKEIDRERQKLEREFLEKIDVLRREIGETVSALKERVNQLELEASKTFVHRDSFIELSKSLQRAMDALTERIEKWVEKMEEKMERHMGDRR